MTNVTFFDIGDTLASARVDTQGLVTSLDVLPFVVDVLRAFALVPAEGGTPHRLGVISNTGSQSKASLDTVLQQSGLALFFDPALRLYSSVEGITKEHEEFFRLASDRAGVPTTGCLFVGESARERQVASSAGMRVSPHVLHALHLLQTA